MGVHLRMLVVVAGVPCPDVIYLEAAAVTLPPLFHLGVMSQTLVGIGVSSFLM
jgi:hypothetical protein